MPIGPVLHVSCSSPGEPRTAATTQIYKSSLAVLNWFDDLAILKWAILANQLDTAFNLLLARVNQM